MMRFDRDYFRRRAEAELALAASAGHPAAMRAHYYLAGYYLDKAHAPRARSLRRAARHQAAPLTAASDISSEMA